MAEISMSHIRKVYPGNVEVIPDLNLEIRDKEFVVLVGPSGCGKSTTLRMIAGLEEITDGEMKIGDRVVNDVEPKDRDISMVFQNYALYPHMTVYKNMAFALKLRKVPKDEIRAKVEEAAKILDIEHLLNRKPKQLSGGQRQRVALGRAMVRDPAVFLLDEPLSNLDAKLRTQMRTEIIKLHKRLDTTFVYVTHDQTEAMTMGDRIVVMKEGVIQQADVPQVLYDHPDNLFVAGFIGSPQMNFMKAVLKKNEEGYEVQIGSQVIPLSKGRTGLDPYVNRTVVVGIRPEDFHVEEEFFHGNPGSVITLNVDIAEMMGAEIYAHCDWNGTALTVRVPSRAQVRSKDTIRVAIDLEKIHLFDEESTNRIGE